jgi:colicin import membrane protein
MNRLQKKCVIGTAGIHLLLLVILFVGPAFFSPRPKVNGEPTIDVIPAKLVDGLLSSGEPDAAPPPPAPAFIPPQPPPTPEKVVKPEPDRMPDKLSPDSLTPVVKTPKTEPRKINTTLVTRPTPKNSPTTSNTLQSQQDRQAQAISGALQRLKGNLTPGTKVGMPGTGTASYASYGTVIVSVYRHAWVPPDGMASDNAIVKFSVTIASDGTVISSRITDPSGDANIDSAVQRMLDRVTFIEPFPEGATEKQRSYPVNFNATRRTLE